MYLTKEAMTFLNRTLHLPATGCEQDWDIEMADANRVDEFAEFLADRTLKDNERLALMALTMASLEELSYQRTIPPGLWNRVKSILQQHRPLYADLIDEWSAKEDDGHAISPLVRLL